MALRIRRCSHYLSCCVPFLAHNYHAAKLLLAAEVTAMSRVRAAVYRPAVAPRPYSELTRCNGIPCCPDSKSVLANKNVLLLRRLPSCRLWVSRRGNRNHAG